jgi:hypothetical protein
MMVHAWSHHGGESHVSIIFFDCILKYALTTRNQNPLRTTFPLQVIFYDLMMMVVELYKNNKIAPPPLLSTHFSADKRERTDKKGPHNSTIIITCLHLISNTINLSVVNHRSNRVKISNKIRSNRVNKDKFKRIPPFSHPSGVY